MASKRKGKRRAAAPKATSAAERDSLDALIPDEPQDPVTEAYARTGRADTSGISGLSQSDETAGEQRRELYRRGATLVSRID